MRIIRVAWYSGSLSTGLLAWHKIVQYSIFYSYTHNNPSKLLSPAWMPKADSVGAYLQIQFATRRTVISFVIKGRKDHDQWLTRLKLQHSLDGEDDTWQTYMRPYGTEFVSCLLFLLNCTNILDVLNFILDMLFIYMDFKSIGLSSSLAYIIHT